jgi:hypothetical protein
MNILSAARCSTAMFLGCRHSECPRPVLCETACADKAATKRYVPQTEDEANEEMDNGRNTGGKSNL